MDTLKIPLPHAPPPIANLLRETRWIAEWTASAIGKDLKDLPAGDGHGVLLLPGFLATDRSLEPLARVLRRLGYRTYRSGLNPNPGPTSATVSWLRERVPDVLARAKGPITLLGQSLGGIYAREIARWYPSRVRMVITLGSPFRDPDHTRASRVTAALHRWWGPEGRRSRRSIARPLPVPTTSIYSKTDGIVPWQACLEIRGPRRENIEVDTSHIGMSLHPSVMRIVADRLAIPRRRWYPYRIQAAPARRA
jgi:pimeloyl-ACP methyl ester carboxylesterase